MTNNNIPKLILYIGFSCPFCQKVMLFMAENQIDITVIDVWEDEAEFKKLRSLSGKTQVPCLQIDDDYLLESDDIIKKLREYFSS